jgi:hypothetical protein
MIGGTNLFPAVSLTVFGVGMLKWDVLVMVNVGKKFPESDITVPYALRK